MCAGGDALVLMPTADKTFHALTTDKSTTLDAFGHMFGIGERKKWDYGARFVALIRSHEGLDG